MKRAVITGGNAGLGLETARALIDTHGFAVTLACRRAAAAEAAVEALRRGRPNAEVEAVALDLADLASVRAAAAALKGDGRPLIDVLYCNAGIQTVSARETTADGIEKTFAVNHLGHFLLVNLLREQMAPDGRIIFVASGTHDPAQRTGIPEPRIPSAELVAFPEKDPFYEDLSSQAVGQRHYSTSKLCNVICAYELARRLKTRPSEEKSSDLWAAAFDPGLMPGTGLARTYPWPVRAIWHALLPAARFFLRNTNSPRASGVRLASLGAQSFRDHPSGSYFEGLKPIRSSRQSYDRDLWQDLWEVSCRLSGLSSEPSLGPDAATPEMTARQNGSPGRTAPRSP